MKLIIIYGPPAVGKLTVAREIAKRTNLKVFHNHLSIDAITPIFEFLSPPFRRLMRLIRTAVIAEAARQDVSLIFTGIYIRGEDEENIEIIAKAAENDGGQVCFVLLTCDPKTLEHRVTAESRNEFGKTKSVEHLRQDLAKFDYFSPVPGRETLIIDTTEVSPDEAAEQIIEYYKLET
jgi:shikimate kinase